MRNDHEFLNEFKKNIKVPEIVDEKCREAYNIIYNECEQTSKKKKRITFKTGMTLAACVAVISITAAALPVMAEHIPMLQSAYEYISGKTYTKDTAQKNDLTKYSKSVNLNQEAKSADIVMQSVYCDGSNLSISLALTPKSDILKDMTGIDGKLSITINGEMLNQEEPWKNVIGFTAGDDGNYYSVIHYSNLNITDESQIKIKIYALQGRNAYIQNWVPNDDYSGCYEPESTDLLEDKYEFEYTVNPDTSHNKTYEVNETQGNVTLESVTVTPFMTSISINGIDGDCQSLRVFDQDRNELEYMGTGVCDMATPLKTAKTLTVEIFRLDQDDFPTEYSFDVDIDEGFADKYTVEFNIDTSKIIYNPPEEEIEAMNESHMNEKYEKINQALNTVKANPLGTIIPNTYSDDNGSSYTINFKIIGSELGEISDYDIDEERLEWYKHFEVVDLNNAKLLLITYEIENPDNCEREICFTGLNGIIKNFSSDYSNYLNDYDYVSYKENYGKNSYIYNFAPYETKTITVGHILSESQIENGVYIYRPKNSSNELITPNNLLNEKIELYEVE